MYIIDGIAYAGEKKAEIKVCGIKALSDFTLLIRFNTGEIRKFDFKPQLNKKAYQKLNDIDTFKDVYIDYGVPVWGNGDIDISPEFLYCNSVSSQETA